MGVAYWTDKGVAPGAGGLHGHGSVGAAGEVVQFRELVPEASLGVKLHGIGDISRWVAARMRILSPKDPIRLWRHPGCSSDPQGYQALPRRVLLCRV